MTSVKEFRVERPPTKTSLGQGAFKFTDDYSVFDWGKMPDAIPDKGASLCATGASTFEALEAAGVPTHYQGVVADGDVVSFEEAARPPTEMAIDLTRIPNLPHDGREYDYETFHANTGDHYLIPLEVVFRNRAPVGSSLRERTDPFDHGLASEVWPDRAIALDEPVVEFSTKFEEEDRYLSREEADEIAGRASIEELERVAMAVNDVVSKKAAVAGLTHEDGKIECMYVDGEIRVADVTGTFDENRFSFQGEQVSKECLRQYHKRTQSAWVEAVSLAKSDAERRGVADWRSLCEHNPEPLHEDVVQTARDMYTAGANAYMGRDMFDAPSLEDAMESVREL